MLSNEKKIEVTERIQNSKTFQKASTSSALLRYLVKSEIEGSFLKESIINLEFFGEKSDPAKSNPRVRVNMYNLRKKLDVYYQTEGVDEKWRLVINKGQYSVRYERQNQKEKTLPQFNLRQKLPYILLTIVCALFLVDKIPQKKPELWNNLLINEHPTTLYIGDVFGMKGKTITGPDGWTRDYHINNIQEYYTLLEQQPKLKSLLEPASYSYVTGMGVHAAHKIGHLFATYQKDFDIRFSSKTSFEDIKNGNAVYAGPLRNENKFITLFNNANPYFQIRNEKLILKGHNSLPNKTFKVNTSGEDSDYAIVSRIPGPQNTEQFFFFSNHDIGVMATVELFTNEDSLRVFTNKYLDGKSNFTAIYKATGKERTNMGLETVVVVPF